MIPIMDADYAVCIFSAVWKTKCARTKVNTQRIFKALHALPERDQLALEYRYRFNMPFREIGQRLGGISGAAVSHSISRALRRLRQISNQYMDFTPIIEHYENSLKEKDAVIDEKDALIVELNNTIKEKEETLSYLNKELEILLLKRKQYQFEEKNSKEQNLKKIADMSFSKRIKTVLSHANILYCVDLLAFDSFDEFSRIRGVGPVATIEIALTMSASGHREWVALALRNTQLELRETIQKAIE